MTLLLLRVRVTTLSARDEIIIILYSQLALNICARADLPHECARMRSRLCLLANSQPRAFWETTFELYYIYIMYTLHDYLHAVAML